MPLPPSRLPLSYTCFPTYSTVWFSSSLVASCWGGALFLTHWDEWVSLFLYTYTPTLYMSDFCGKVFEIIIVSVHRIQTPGARRDWSICLWSPANDLQVGSVNQHWHGGKNVSKAHMQKAQLEIQNGHVSDSLWVLLPSENRHPSPTSSSSTPFPFLRCWISYFGAGVEPRASHMLSEYSATEKYPSSTPIFT